MCHRIPGVAPESFLMGLLYAGRLPRAWVSQNIVHVINLKEPKLNHSNCLRAWLPKWHTKEKQNGTAKTFLWLCNVFGWAISAFPLYFTLKTVL